MPKYILITVCIGDREIYTLQFDTREEAVSAMTNELLQSIPLGWYNDDDYEVIIDKINHQDLYMADDYTVMINKEIGAAWFGGGDCSSDMKYDWKIVEVK